MLDSLVALITDLPTPRRDALSTIHVQTSTAVIPTPKTKTESNDLKQRLRKQGYPSLRAFAERRGYKYLDVSDVVRGVRRGYWGVGRDIAKDLGLNPEA